MISITVTAEEVGGLRQELLAALNALPAYEADGMPSNSGTNAGRALKRRLVAVPDDGNNAVPECPEHGLSVRSKYGGLYCPHEDDSGTYCRWSWKPGKLAAS